MVEDTTEDKNLDEEKKEYQRQYHLRNKDKRNQQSRDWRKAKKEENVDYYKEYRLQNRDTINRNQRQGFWSRKKDIKQCYRYWYDLCNGDYNAYRRITIRLAREELFHVLNQHWCIKCGQHDKRCLQFDHIHGGGRKETRQYASRKSAYFYMYYVQNPELARKTLQVLCSNCNWIKRFEQSELSL